MTESTPRMQIDYPSEFEEPFFDSAQSGALGTDAITHANAENGNIQFLGGGIMGFDAGTDLVFWGSDVLVSGFSTPFNLKLGGPASIEIQDGEVIYFVMPRLLAAQATMTLIRSNRIFFEGVRLSDLRLFCAREGDVVYFANGLSLKDGDTGVLFGAGLINIAVIPAHDHLAPLVIEPPSAGVGTLDAALTSPELAKLEVYRNGFMQADPGDYSLNIGTGIVTLVTPTVSAFERFVLLREQLDTSSPTTTHSHLTRLDVSPPPATSLIDMLVVAPTLEAAKVYRNGQLLSDPADYSLDLGTGFVTLVVPSAPGDIYSSFRRIAV